MPRASGRYVESLSAYARQFLEMMQKPDVDQIDGLSPAISIEQKTTSRNPRSTVGTVTEIYDYMRLLWARVGVPYSPATGLPIESQTVSQMVDRILALPEGTRLYLLAPVVRGRKGEYRKELAEFLKKGYQRVKVDGKFYEIAEVPALDKKFTHDIDVVVDRIVVRPDIGTRLADSLEQALKLAEGLAIAEMADTTGVAGAKANKQRNETSERLIFSRNSPARSPASPFRKSSRGCSRSTTRSAPARNAAASASSSTSIPSWSSRQGAHAEERRDRAVGEVVEPLLHPDAAGAGEVLQVHARQQMEGPAEDRPEGDPARLGR
jgi:excinuclease UvrABC ATPase subunit